MSEIKHYSDLTIGDEDHIISALDVQLYKLRTGFLKHDPLAKKLYEQWLADYKQGKDPDCYFSVKMRDHYSRYYRSK